MVNLLKIISLAQTFEVLMDVKDSFV